MTAYQVALETAQLNGLRTVIAHVRDTEYDDEPTCWLVLFTKDGAVVVYDDDPDSVVSTGNYKGRFVEVMP